jgi:hypothetical protein
MSSGRRRRRFNSAASRGLIWRPRIERATSTLENPQTLGANDGLCACLRRKLLKNSFDVGFNRFRRDAEFSRDLLIRLASRNILEDRPLPVRNELRRVGGFFLAHQRHQVGDEASWLIIRSINAAIRTR